MKALALLTLLVSASLAQASVCGSGQRTGASLRDGLLQLTGTQNQPGHLDPIGELADPAPPYVADNGAIEIYGSGTYFIRYADWSEFLTGGCYDVIPLQLHGPAGTNYVEDPWDIRKFRVIKAGQPNSEVIIAGVMSPTNGETQPSWPVDNITRRLFFFRPDQTLQWIRDLAPLVGQVSQSWLDHSYGGNLLQLGIPLNTLVADISNAIGFFYERVSDDQGNTPYKTELFADAFPNSSAVQFGQQISIFSIGVVPYPSLRRLSGGYLAEGPRPIQVTIQGQTYFLIGFSSGDYPTDNYHINYLWSRNLFGPYTAKLTPDGSDLLDLGANIKTQYGLSWVGRPAFFLAPDGSYQMLFHGVEKSMVPNNDYSAWPSNENDFFRNIYKVGVTLTLDANGEPTVILN